MRKIQSEHSSVCLVSKTVTSEVYYPKDKTSLFV